MKIILYLRCITITEKNLSIQLQTRKPYNTQTQLVSECKFDMRAVPRWPSGATDTMHPMS